MIPDDKTTSRPATAMQIAMLTIADGVADPNCLAAYIRPTSFVRMCNAIAKSGAIRNDSSIESLRGRIQREHLHRPYQFLPLDRQTEANVTALQALEFETDGQEIKIRKKSTGRKGTR